MHTLSSATFCPVYPSLSPLRRQTFSPLAWQRTGYSVDPPRHAPLYAAWPTQNYPQTPPRRPSPKTHNAPRLLLPPHALFPFSSSTFPMFPPQLPHPTPGQPCAAVYGPSQGACLGLICNARSARPRDVTLVRRERKRASQLHIGLARLRFFFSSTAFSQRRLPFICRVATSPSPPTQ